MHFEGRLCQQNSRIPAFVRKLFVYFVIRKEIEHKNVKRQVLEPLPANGSLKKSQPIARQVRFDCLQNLEIWSLFQGLAATHTAICEWWVEFFIAAQFVKNLRQRFQPLKWRFWDEFFFRISFSNFWFLSLLLARSRRVLANLEERIEKFIDAAFFWPVENVPGT